MKRIDPRWWQIGSLTALLVYGIAILHFEVTPLRALLIFGAAQLAQLLCSRLSGIAYEWKSASELLRISSESESPEIAALFHSYAMPLMREQRSCASCAVPKMSSARSGVTSKWRMPIP